MGAKPYAFPPWPPNLPDYEIKELVAHATDYALAQGLVVRPFPSAPGEEEKSADPRNGNIPQSAAVLHAPFSLFPTPFPRSCYQEAFAIQVLYNELYARVAGDREFLRSTLADVIRVDDFQKSLIDIWEEVEEKGTRQQRLSLGLFRSDYLLHAPDIESTISSNTGTENQGIEVGDVGIKQVEFNTISSSFGALSTRVTELHRYLLDTTTFYGASPFLIPENFPPNRTLEDLASGLAFCHSTYIQEKTNNVQRSARQIKIAFVIQEDERNAFDQRLIEYALLRT